MISCRRAGGSGNDQLFGLVGRCGIPPARTELYEVTREVVRVTIWCSACGEAARGRVGCFGSANRSIERGWAEAHPTAEVSREGKGGLVQIRRVVTFRRLLGLVAPGAVDLAPANHGRAFGDVGGPALHVRVLVH